MKPEEIQEKPIERREATVDQRQIQLSGVQTGSVPIQMKSFDIIVFDSDEHGRPKQIPINGVKAMSAQELVSLYAMEGTKIRILKEYGETKIPLPEHFKKPVVQERHAETKVSEIRDVIQIPPQAKPPYEAKSIPEARPVSIVSQSAEPPKFFEIGGIKCKMENGKMFQEQWVRVDNSKFRLVSDASNKIVGMTGKHLEMLKWVQIEDVGGGCENA